MASEKPELEYKPSIIDIVTSIAIVGKARTQTRFSGKFPNGIRLFSADPGNPTGAKLHRHAAKILLPHPPANTIRGFENHQVLHSLLRQHLRRRYTFHRKETNIKTIWKNQQFNTENREDKKRKMKNELGRARIALNNTEKPKPRKINHSIHKNNTDPDDKNEKNEAGRGYISPETPAPTTITEHRVIESITQTKKEIEKGRPLRLSFC